MESIHGRNILNLVQEHGEPVSREELLTAIGNHFGETVRFHTCSASDMSAEQLLDMFLEKGKLILEGGMILFHGCNCGCH